tara:strand:- start:442 stop:744 length:303 start_codon:yes stop_codon:yes gene_type:complete
MAWLWVPAALVALACVLLPKSWQEKIPITSCFLLYFWATLRPLHHFLGKTQDLPHLEILRDPRVRGRLLPVGFQYDAASGSCRGESDGVSYNERALLIRA